MTAAMLSQQCECGAAMRAGSRKSTTEVAGDLQRGTGSGAPNGEQGRSEGARAWRAARKYGEQCCVESTTARRKHSTTAADGDTQQHEGAGDGRKGQGTGWRSRDTTL
jgi:hypothetical protein